MKTIDLKGNPYAKVSERIKQFREDCPNGLIETKPQIQPDGSMIFSTRILKDKSDTNSGEATGHSLGKVTGDKNFEKLESISVGRALAMLGYMASGEIASSEEMEDYNKWKDNKIDEVIQEMNQAETLDKLKTMFTSLGSLMANSRIIEAKDNRKAVLSENTK